MLIDVGGCLRATCGWQGCGYDGERLYRRIHRVCRTDHGALTRVVGSFGLGDLRRNTYGRWIVIVRSVRDL